MRSSSPFMMPSIMLSIVSVSAPRISPAAISMESRRDDIRSVPSAIQSVFNKASPSDTARLIAASAIYGAASTIALTKDVTISRP